MWGTGGERVTGILGMKQCRMNWGQATLLCNQQPVTSFLCILVYSLLAREGLSRVREPKSAEH